MWVRWFSFLLFLLCTPIHSVAATAVPTGFIAQFAREKDFNGTILIARGNGPVYQRSFGLANFELAVPNTNATKYRVASITKAFTSVLILQLYEEGRLELQKTIGDYLPTYIGEGRDKVTIHQLLNHTSGIDNMDKVASLNDALTNGLPPYQSPFTRDQILTKFASGPLVNAPGTTFDYNNADFIVLGRIIETIYQKSYEDVLREKILLPLGLRNTGMMRQQAVLRGLANTYFYRDDINAMVPDLPSYPENWFAAGGLYATANDVLTFSNALFDGRLLKPATLTLMIAPGLEDYGYGVWSYKAVFQGVSKRIVKRPGQIMGAQAQLYRYVDDNVTIVILSNATRGSLDDLVAEIGKRMVGYN